MSPERLSLLSCRVRTPSWVVMGTESHWCVVHQIPQDALSFAVISPNQSIAFLTTSSTDAGIWCCNAWLPQHAVLRARAVLRRRGAQHPRPQRGPVHDAHPRRSRGDIMYITALVLLTVTCLWCYCPQNQNTVGTNQHTVGLQSYIDVVKF